MVKSYVIVNPKKLNFILPDLEALPITLSILPLVRLVIEVVAGVDGLDLRVLAVTQANVTHVVGVQLENVFRGLIIKINQNHTNFRINFKFI